MKMLIIDGEDYAALSFEGKYKGTKVIDIINDLKKFKRTKKNEGYWQLSIKEFEGEVSQSFIDFARGQIDYDTSKHEMWYHESETI